MLPLDPGLSLSELVRRAVQNLCQFDYEGWQAWLDHDEHGPGIAAVARRCPPDRLYRLHDWPGTPLVIVDGYKAAEAGAPAHCIVRPLKSDKLLGAPPEALEDVTEQALAYRLSEQSPAA